MHKGTVKYWYHENDLGVFPESSSWRVRFLRALATPLLPGNWLIGNAFPVYRNEWCCCWYDGVVLKLTLRFVSYERKWVPLWLKRKGFRLGNLSKLEVAPFIPFLPSLHYLGTP